MLYVNGVPAANGLPAEYPSENTTYDNTTSGLDATEVQGAIDELAADASKSFVLSNQSLTFTNLVATISDSRVTANTSVHADFTDATLSAASAANVSVESISGAIKFTAVTAPTSTLVCDIICWNK